MESDGLKYIYLVLRRWWLILIAIIVTAGLTYFLRERQTPQYQAEVLMSIGAALNNPNPQLSQVEIAQDLVPTYVRLVSTYGILVATIDALDLDMSPDRLRGKVDADAIRDTSFIVVKVSDPDPELAAVIANELAEQLIIASPSLSVEQQANLAAIMRERDRLDSDILDLAAQRSAYQEDLQAAIEADNQETITEIVPELNRVNEQLETATTNLATYIELIQRYEDGINQLTIVDPARAPRSPEGMSSRIIAVAGGIVGAVLAISTILFFEYIDNTIRTQDEASRVFRSPVLGVIPRSRRISSNLERYLSAQSPPRMTIEDYRTVQTSLLFSSSSGKTGPLVRPESRVYIIASPNPREGRTTTIANLAVIAAEAGLRVLLVDADLRKPDIHRIFGLQNQSGLASLLAQTAAEPEMLNGSNGSNGRFLEVFDEYVQETKLPNLRIMSSGLNGTELRSTQLLGFDNLRRCVEIIQNSGQFDVVLFDTAPTSTTADSYVLAATTQANVILLAEAKRTSRASAIKTREQFTHLNANLNGVILNKF